MTVTARRAAAGRPAVRARPLLLATLEGVWNARLEPPGDEDDEDEGD